jgi:drug/metabolite transporter (DMT)-like permease
MARGRAACRALSSRRSILWALASAALFGASTPLAKLLLGEISPLLLAAILYLGSGLGLALWLGFRVLKAKASAPLGHRDWPWLAGAIAAGGVAGPVLLMLGLARTAGSTASLLLNLEAVLTAAIAWTLFRENVDRRVFLGMLAIIAGGVLLSWEELPRAGGVAGPLLVAAACLAWAIDNNLTRRVSGGDAVKIACLKGVVAGAVNFAIAVAVGASLPRLGALGGAAVVGALGYGLSLVLFIVALRHLGAARTAAYFSVAPFFGAALALAVLGEQPTTPFWIAAGLMVLGVWLHVSERHVHQHAHEAMTHTHSHVHDEHHQHEHDSAWDGREPHVHPHRHDRLVHAHPHYPDLHHRHEH